VTALYFLAVFLLSIALMIVTLVQLLYLESLRLRPRSAPQRRRSHTFQYPATRPLR